MEVVLELAISGNIASCASFGASACKALSWALFANECAVVVEPIGALGQACRPIQPLLSDRGDRGVARETRLSIVRETSRAR